jgi:hypothetical protein
VVDWEDWAEIRRLHRVERMPIKVIARALGFSTTTVTAAYSPPANELAVRATTTDSERKTQPQYKPYRTMAAKTTQSVNSPRPRIVTASGRP